MDEHEQLPIVLSIIPGSYEAILTILLTEPLFLAPSLTPEHPFQVDEATSAVLKTQTIPTWLVGLSTSELGAGCYKREWPWRSLVA